MLVVRCLRTVEGLVIRQPLLRVRRDPTCYRSPHVRGGADDEGRRAADWRIAHGGLRSRRTGGRSHQRCCSRGRRCRTSSSRDLPEQELPSSPAQTWGNGVLNCTTLGTDTVIVRISDGKRRCARCGAGCTARRSRTDLLQRQRSTVASQPCAATSDSHTSMDASLQTRPNTFAARPCIRTIPPAWTEPRSSRSCSQPNASTTRTPRSPSSPDSTAFASPNLAQPTSKTGRSNTDTEHSAFSAKATSPPSFRSFRERHERSTWPSANNASVATRCRSPS